MFVNTLILIDRFLIFGMILSFLAICTQLVLDEVCLEVANVKQRSCRLEILTVSFSNLNHVGHNVSNFAIDIPYAQDIRK